jgi:hypothetical protein
MRESQYAFAPRAREWSRRFRYWRSGQNTENISIYTTSKLHVNKYNSMKWRKDLAMTIEMIPLDRREPSPANAQAGQNGSERAIAEIKRREAATQ